MQTHFRTHGTLGFCQRNSTRDLLSDMLVILRAHILANVTSCSFPLPAWDGTPWTSTVCETEMGYRKKAYTILCRFARAFFSKKFAEKSPCNVLPDLDVYERIEAGNVSSLRSACH